MRAATKLLQEHDNKFVFLFLDMKISDSFTNLLVKHISKTDGCKRPKK